MIKAGEDELVCDFAETYGILEPRALGAGKMAVLACGLRDTARIRQKLCGARAGTDTQLLACAVDLLGLIAWRTCCKPGEARPASVLEQLAGGACCVAAPADGAADPPVCSFDTAAGFEAARSGILAAAKKKAGTDPAKTAPERRAEHGN